MPLRTKPLPLPFEIWNIKIEGESINEKKEFQITTVARSIGQAIDECIEKAHNDFDAICDIEVSFVKTVWPQRDL